MSKIIDRKTGETILEDKGQYVAGVVIDYLTSQSYNLEKGENTIDFLKSFWGNTDIGNMNLKSLINEFSFLQKAKASSNIIMTGDYYFVEPEENDSKNWTNILQVTTGNKNLEAIDE